VQGGGVSAQVAYWCGAAAAAAGVGWEKMKID